MTFGVPPPMWAKTWRTSDVWVLKRCSTVRDRLVVFVGKLSSTGDVPPTPGRSTATRRIPTFRADVARSFRTTKHLETPSGKNTTARSPRDPDVLYRTLRPPYSTTPSNGSSGSSTDASRRRLKIRIPTLECCRRKRKNAGPPSKSLSKDPGASKKKTNKRVLRS